MHVRVCACVCAAIRLEPTAPLFGVERVARTDRTRRLGISVFLADESGHNAVHGGCGSVNPNAQFWRRCGAALLSGRRGVACMPRCAVWLAGFAIPVVISH